MKQTTVTVVKQITQEQCAHVSQKWTREPVSVS